MLDRVEFGPERAVDHAAAELDHEPANDRRIDLDVDPYVLSGHRVEGILDLAALKTALAEISGSPSVEVAVKIDQSIIGGLIVKLGSRMVDGSLKTKLDSIRTRMKEVG